MKRYFIVGYYCELKDGNMQHGLYGVRSQDGIYGQKQLSNMILSEVEEAKVAVILSVCELTKEDFNYFLNN